MAIFCVQALFYISPTFISISNAQSSSLNLGISSEVQQSIDKDCHSQMLGIFLDSSGHMLTKLSDYQLQSISCNETSVGLHYKQSDNSLEISLTDNKMVNQSMASAGSTKLADRLLGIQKLGLQTQETTIQAFNELSAKHPELAIEFEKTTPPAVKLSILTGDHMYYRRVPCEESQCGAIEAQALIRNERYFFKIDAENYAVANSKQAANDFIKGILQAIKLENLPY
ncbi:hypothetical protein Z042_02810 [Chania multitudinisentens RB-25]|uniref:Uncharacterized protein n=2 Tax=Chania TaxID=1745211 RepID=W0LJW5_9GAMM|nr:hypothetical protein Z042_02810 [Chania multitudinisentens RB-25]